MNRWAANNPELYEQLGHDGYVEHFRDAADLERKRQKEEGVFIPDSEGGGNFDEHGRHLLPCLVCGEELTPNGRECRRCKASIEDDRLNRGE